MEGVLLHDQQIYTMCKHLLLNIPCFQHYINVFKSLVNYFPSLCKQLHEVQGLCNQKDSLKTISQLYICELLTEVFNSSQFMKSYQFILMLLSLKRIPITLISNHKKTDKCNWNNTINVTLTVMI